MQVTLEDIKVMCVVAIGGLEGIKDAWDKLEAPLPSLKGRKFYGTYLNGEYRACVALDDDDPATLGLDTIPGGTYVRRKIQNWSERTSEIGETFAAMAAEYPIDPTRPEIEFYRSQKELILYMPITRVRHRAENNVTVRMNAAQQADGADLVARGGSSAGHWAFIWYGKIVFGKMRFGGLRSYR